MAAQKNINIVYNIDTQSIQVAKAQVDQAKQATDQLNQSIKGLGDQGAANTQKFSNTIEGLKVQMSQLKGQIDNTSQSDTATLNSRISLYKEMQKELDKYNSGLKETQTQTQNVGTSFNGLYTTIKAVITAGLLRELVNVNLEMARLAGQVEGVKRAFDRLPNSTILLEDLRKSTHGTVNELELMQTALKAQNFKIPLEQLGTLLEFASIRAQQTGQSVEYLVNSIVLGLGYNSIRRLDNVGLSVDSLKQKMKETGMTLREAFGSFINEELQKMGGYLETSATKVEQLSSSWKNLKILLSQKFESTGMIAVLQETVQGFSDFIKGRKQVNDDLNKSIAVNNAQGFLSAKQTIESIQTEIDMLSKEMQARGALKATIKEQIQALVNLHDIAVQPEIDQLQEKYKALANQNDISQKEIQIYKQKQAAMANPPEKEQIGLIEALDEKIKMLNEELIKTTSQKRIIQIQVEIKQLESQRLDLLDPERASRQAKETYDKINKEIAQAVREGSPKVLQEVNKQVDAYNNELVKGSQKEMKQFIDGLKLAMKEAEKIEDEQERRRRRLLGFLGQQLFTNARQIASEMVQQEVAEYDERIQNLHDFYSQQESLAGNNTKAIERLKKEEAKQQKQLEKERKEAQKKANIERIEIDTAANVIRSILENGGVPWGLPFGAIAAAMGLVQIAFVNKFAEGVIDLKGPGTTTSDSIPSMLSRGESVMTAEETRGSMNILKGIRAKKLNDQILEKLTVTTDGIVAKMDLDPLINEYRKSKAPDLVRQFGTIYEAKEIGKNTKRIIRSKSFTN